MARATNLEKSREKFRRSFAARRTEPARRHLRQVPDQVLINEYVPGQSIAANVDYHPQFGDEVAMVSLLNAYPMQFGRNAEVYEQWLEGRSLCVISGLAAKNGRTKSRDSAATT